MRITNLRLENWRNFPTVNLDLGRRAFFVGPNASGKSNLLDAIRFLRDLVSVHGGLQEAVKERGGVGQIRSFSARKNPNVSVSLSVGDDEEPARWVYELEFSASSSKSRLPEIRAERVWATAAEKLHKLLDRPDNSDRHDPERLSQTALQQVNANTEFRELADFLRGVQYLHVVPEIVRDPRRALSEDSFGGNLIARINATTRKTRDARLKRMEDALRIAVPQLSNLELEVDERGVPHLRAKYEHWRPQGAWQRENHFSDGTLRLLGLIWSLQEAEGPILLEEPELSLNQGIVKSLAPMISRATRRSKRQALITTHSADILSDAVRLDEVHLLRVTKQGTEVATGVELEAVRLMVEEGVPLGEAILPRAVAANAHQLSLIDLLTS